MKKYILAALLLFSTSHSFSAVLSKDDKIKTFKDFSGGLNTQSGPNNLADNETPNMTNILIDEKPKSIVTRNGIQSVISTNTLSKINFMFEYVTGNGGREMLVSDSSRILKTSDFTSFTLLKSTLNTAGVLRAVQGRGKVMLTNGLDPVMYYDGNSCIFLDGNNGFPNVPRGKYPGFYQDRFWIYNTTTNDSALHFSENSSTDGFAIDPLTDIRSWPVVNQLNIGVGDGRPGTGVDVFKGLLQVHKDRGSIYTIYGTDANTYTARRTNAHSGTISWESISQDDNLEYYLAKDGIYAFDGGDTVRISDKIEPDVNSIVSNLARIIDNTWNTKADFENGSLFSNTTTTANGYVTLISTQIGEVVLPVDAANVYLFEAGQSTFTPWIVISTPGYYFGNFGSGYIDKIRLGYRQVAGFDNTFTSVTVRNFSTNKQGTGFMRNAGDVDTFSGCDADDVCTSNDILFNEKVDFTAAQWGSGNVKFKIESSAADVGVSVRISSPTNPNNAAAFYIASTGSYTSNVATVSNINTWDTFNSINQTNSGSINFFIKGATSAVNIDTETYTNIVPGSLINLPIAKNYVQFMTTLTALSSVTYPAIDNVVINHNEGGSSDSRPFAVTWANRYWLVVTTQSSESSTVIYVKSKITNSVSNAWIKFTDINLRSMSKFGDSLYGGSSSSGTIYRLDYGTNDDGSPITFLYDFPETGMTVDYLDKTQTSYFIDLEKQAGANLQLGCSINGNAYNYISLSIDGSGRLIKNVKLNSNSGIAKIGTFFRYRLLNTELDKPMSIDSFSVVYQDTLVKEQTQ